MISKKSRWGYLSTSDFFNRKIPSTKQQTISKFEFPMTQTRLGIESL